MTLALNNAANVERYYTGLGGSCDESTLLDSTHVFSADVTQVTICNEAAPPPRHSRAASGFPERAPLSAAAGGVPTQDYLRERRDELEHVRVLRHDC